MHLYFVPPPTAWVCEGKEGVVKTEFNKDDIDDEEIVNENIEEEVNINMMG